MLSEHVDGEDLSPALIGRCTDAAETDDLAVTLVDKSGAPGRESALPPTPAGVDVESLEKARRQ
jgi:hypothetical protein